MVETFDVVACSYIDLEMKRNRLGRKAAVLLVGDEGFFTILDRWQTQQRFISVAPGVTKWSITDPMLIVLSDALKGKQGRFEPWPEEWKVSAWPNV